MVRAKEHMSNKPPSLPPQEWPEGDSHLPHLRTASGALAQRTLPVQPSVPAPEGGSQLQGSPSQGSSWL